MSNKEQLKKKFKEMIEDEEYGFTDEQISMLAFAANIFIEDEVHIEDMILEENDDCYYIREGHKSDIIESLNSDIMYLRRENEELEREVEHLQGNIDDALKIIENY